MDERQPAREGKYVESERDRRTANFVIVAFFLVVVGAGIWLVNAMVEQRAIDDCVGQGRRNCVPIEVPAR